MSTNTIKTLTLTLDADGADSPASVECQLTTAMLDSENVGGETITTFCGSTELPGSASYTLHIGGFQDYGQASAVCDLLHTAFVNGQDSSDTTSDLLDYVLTVGTATRTGQCRPLVDVPFGGDAGSALTFTTDLACTGAPTDGTTTP